MPEIPGWTQKAGLDKKIEGTPQPSYIRYSDNGETRFWVELTSQDAPIGDGPDGIRRTVTIQGMPAELYYVEATSVLPAVTYVDWPVPDQGSGCDLVSAWGDVSPKRALKVLQDVDVNSQ